MSECSSTPAVVVAPQGPPTSFGSAAVLGEGGAVTHAEGASPKGPSVPSPSASAEELRASTSERPTARDVVDLSSPSPLGGAEARAEEEREALTAEVALDGAAAVFPEAVAETPDREQDPLSLIMMVPLARWRNWGSPRADSLHRLLSSS